MALIGASLFGCVGVGGCVGVCVWCSLNELQILGWMVGCACVRMCVRVCVWVGGWVDGWVGGVRVQSTSTVRMSHVTRMNESCP